MAKDGQEVIQAKLLLSSTHHKPQPHNSMPQPHVSPSHCAQGIKDHWCRCGFIHKLWFRTLGYETTGGGLCGSMVSVCGVRCVRIPLFNFR